MAFASHTASTKSGLFGWVAPLLHTVAERLERRSQYIETVRELDALTARELDDLGLSRADIAHVARKAAYGH